MTEPLSQPELTAFIEWVIKNKEAVMIMAGACIGTGILCKKKMEKKKNKDSRTKRKSSGMKYVPPRVGR